MEDKIAELKEHETHLQSQHEYIHIVATDMKATEQSNYTFLSAASELQSMRAAGKFQTPGDLSIYIIKKMLPRADATKEKLQTEIANVWRKAKNCYNLVTGAAPDEEAAAEDLKAQEAKQ